MRSAIFNEALMATARVACCAALVGCTGADYVVDSSAPAAEDTATTDCELSELEECEQHLESAVIVPGLATQKTEDCCQLVAEAIDEADLDGLGEWEQRGECCEVLGWSGSMACTPWGPPCPPKMVS